MSIDWRHKSLNPTEMRNKFKKNKKWVDNFSFFIDNF